MFRDGSGLRMIVVQSSLQSISIVVSSLNQIFTCLIIFTFNLWGVEFDMIRSSRWLMNSSSFNTLDKKFVIKFKFNDLGDFLAILGEDLIKWLSLLNGSWESIEQKSFLVCWVHDFSLHKFNDHGIRDKFSFFHESICFNSNSGSTLDGSSKKITWWDVLNAHLVLDSRSLRSFPTAWWTQKDDVNFAFTLLFHSRFCSITWICFRYAGSHY